MRARCSMFVPQRSLCWLLCKALLLMVIMEAPTVAKPAAKPAPKLGQQPAAKPAAASSSIPVADGQNVQLFKTMWDQKKKSPRREGVRSSAGAGVVYPLFWGSFA